MIQSIRKVLPRRGPNRVQLVELDGTPTRSIPADPAAWPAWTDNWHWEPGSCPDDLASHVSPALIAEPDETDEEWLTRIELEEEAERDRVERTYFPTREDLADYDRWLSSLGSQARDDNATFSQWEAEAIRRGQITPDELGIIAAGMAI